MIYETIFLLSLFLTVLIEVPVLIILIKLIFRKKISILKIILTGILASALTLPYVWFILPPYLNAKYYILFSEMIVILAEGLIYSWLLKLKLHYSILISLIANTASYLIGRFLLVIS